MFKFVVLVCVFVAAAHAKPGVLRSSIGIAAGPVVATSVVSPAVSVVRTAPIAAIRAPLALSTGVISNGVIGNGIVSGGLVSGGLVSRGVINGGLIGSGKLLAKGLI